MKEQGNHHSSYSSLNNVLQQLDGQVKNSSGESKAQRRIKKQEEKKARKEQRVKAFLESDTPRLKDFYIMYSRMINHPQNLFLAASAFNAFLCLSLFEFNIIDVDQVLKLFETIDIAHFFNKEFSFPIQLAAYLMLVILSLLLLPLPSLLVACKWRWHYYRLPFKVSGLISLARRNYKEENDMYACSLKIVLAPAFQKGPNQEQEKAQKMIAALMIQKANRYLARHTSNEDADMFNEIKWTLKQKKAIDTVDATRNDDPYWKLYNQYIDDLEKYGTSTIDYKNIEDLVALEDARIKNNIDAAKLRPDEYLATGYANSRLAGKWLKLFVRQLAPLHKQHPLIQAIHIESTDDSKSISSD